MKSGELTGKLAQTILLRDLQGLSAKRLLIVGCGKKGELTERQYKQIIQAVLKTLKETNTREVISYLTEIELKKIAIFIGISALPLKRLNTPIINLIISNLKKQKPLF